MKKSIIKHCKDCDQLFVDYLDDRMLTLRNYFLSIGYDEKTTCPECSNGWTVEELELIAKTKAQKKSYPHANPCNVE